MKRPLGVTLIGCLFLVLACAGLAYMARQVQSGLTGWDSIIVAVESVFLGIAAYGMFRLRPWAFWVYVVIAVVGLLSKVTIELVEDPGSWPVVIVVGVFVGMVYVAIGSYLHGALRKAV